MLTLTSGSLSIPGKLARGIGLELAPGPGSGSGNSFSRAFIDPVARLKTRQSALGTIGRPVRHL